MSPKMFINYLKNHEPTFTVASIFHVEGVGSGHYSWPTKQVAFCPYPQIGTNVFSPVMSCFHECVGHVDRLQEMRSIYLSLHQLGCC